MNFRVRRRDISETDVWVVVGRIDSIDFVSKIAEFKFSMRLGFLLTGHGY